MPIGIGWLKRTGNIRIKSPIEKWELISWKPSDCVAALYENKVKTFENNL